MGEGMGNEAQIMPYISSANISCGFHAGNLDTLKKTIELALKQELFSVSFIRLNENSYLTTLRTKLTWGLDKRN